MSDLAFLLLAAKELAKMHQQPDCGKLRDDLKARLRAHGVGVGDENPILNEVSSSYRQRPLQLNGPQQ